MTWPTVALGEVAQWGSGGTPKRSVAEYFGEGIPWLSISDLNDSVVMSSRESLTPLGISSSAAKIVPAGTLLVAMYGSIGKLGIAGRELCTSQAIAFAIPDLDLVDTRYLFHFLLASRPLLVAKGRGGTQSNIGQADLKRVEMPLPPLDEQRRIAAILDQADSIRTKRRHVVDALGMSKGSFVHYVMNGMKTEEVTLESLVFEHQIGLDRRASDQSSDLPFEYVRMDAITGQGGLDLSRLVRVEASAAEVEKYSLEDGDIIFNTRNSRDLVGKSTIYRGRSRLYNNNIMRIRLRDPIAASYLHYFLWSRVGRRQLESIKSGTTSVFAIYAKDLMKVKVPMPAPDGGVLERIAVGVEAVDREIERVTAALDSDDALFASLQARAFKGEL